MPVVFSLITSIVVIMIPTIFAIQLAKQQGLDAEKNNALSIAKNILLNTEKATNQFYIGINKLASLKSEGRCSDKNIELMRKMDFEFNRIRAFGVVFRDRLLCSSYGRYGEGFELGKADLVTSMNTSIRYRVTLPFIKPEGYIVLEKNGYAALIHRELPMDLISNANKISLATFIPELRQFGVMHGYINTEWIDRLGKRSEIIFLEDHYVIAIVRSSQYATGALAAIPIEHLEKRIYNFAIWLVPVGMVVGVIFSFIIIRIATNKISMPSMIRRALKRGDFFLVYQPIVDLTSGRWIGAEALIRWKRTNGDIISPDIFIPIAERSGQIQYITERVIELISQDVEQLCKTAPGFHISINLSAADLQSMKIVNHMSLLTERTGVFPSNLIVEATEHGLMNADMAMNVIQTLRKSGVRVAIDDFGTGYSNLSYLMSLHLDILKIDKSFVDTIGTEAVTSKVISHIIDMAKSLNLEMIAEGVENQQQAQFLRVCGVQYAQGWLFSKPIQFKELINKLSS